MNIRFMKWAVAAATAALFVGCKTGDFTYDGPDYLMFSDTLYRYGVQESNEIFNVQVSATRPATTTAPSASKSSTAGATPWRGATIGCLPAR